MQKKILEQPLLFNKLIIESINDGLFCVDKNLHCTFINAPALKMLGYTFEYCIGKNIHSLIHGKRKDLDLYSETQCPIYNTLTNKKGCISENEIFWRSDGNSIKVRYSSNPMIDNDEIIGAVVLFSDISDQKSKEEDTTQIKTIHESLINATTDTIWAMDRDYKLITCNQSYSQKILDLTGKLPKKGDPLVQEHFDNELLKRWESYYHKVFNGETLMVKEQLYNP